MISVPYRCEKCIEEDSYYGILVFVKPGEEVVVPKCAIHKTVFLVACL